MGTRKAVEPQQWKGFPVIEQVRWFNLSALAVTHLAALYGLFFVPLDRRTLIFAIAYYFFTIFGEMFLVREDFELTIFLGVTAG
jgi:hypothetical protein